LHRKEGRQLAEGKRLSVTQTSLMLDVFLTENHELTIQYINYELDALIIIYS